MLKHWNGKRKASLAIHAAIVSVPLAWSMASTYAAWLFLFGAEQWVLALSMIGIIDGLALLGLVLHIAGIASPFTRARHVLPVVSIVPLMWELYRLLDHNGVWLAIAITAVATTALVFVAWQCYATIEALFISESEAAREHVRDNLKELATILEVQREAQRLVLEFVDGAGVPVVKEVKPAIDVPQRHQASQEAPHAPEGAPLDTSAEQPKPTRQNGAQRATGHSMKAMIARYKQEGKTVAQILEAHPTWKRTTVAPLYSKA